MDTKSLLFGLVGFFLGGLIVSVAATTFNKPDVDMAQGASMGQMTDSLKGRQGDDFDKAFITGMIEHHQGAVEMAKLAQGSAGHEEIKKLSQGIIFAQESEIAEMKRWQVEWGYSTDDVTHADHQMH